MPKSRGRKPKKKPGLTSDRKDLTATRPGQYAAGTLRGSSRQIQGLLLSERSSPDQMVELLLPMLWLTHAHGRPANHCVDGCMTLHYAYAQLGILAQPRAVDLIVSNQRTDQRTFYGRPDPYWSGTSFAGHCVLWLPGSGRLVDATVEQYPEVRSYRLGPIVGRAVMTSARPEQREAVERGELLPGSHIAVQRGELLLLYTAVDHEFDEVVTSAELVVQTTDDYKRSGANLAGHALALLRMPEVVERVREAPYPRLQALLDLLGDTQTSIDERGDYRFAVPGPDGVELALRLDEIAVPEPTTSTVPLPRPRPPTVHVPPPATREEELREVLDDVSTEARAVLPPVAGLDATGLPVLIFEPLRGIGMRGGDGMIREAQVEGIIAAGFTRLLDPPVDPPATLASWSVRRSTDGVELWDHSGLWARARLELDERWLAAAAEAGQVLVVYSVRAGVRVPAHLTTAVYTEVRRAAELRASREQGIVAAAHVPWIDHKTTSRSGKAIGRTRSGSLLGRLRRTSSNKSMP